MKCLRARLWLVLLSSTVVMAEVPPPPTVIINYGSFNGAASGPVATPAPAAIPAPAVSAPSSTENDPEGVSVALNLGYLSAAGSGAFGTVGLAAQWRFLRFFSLDGEGNIAVKALDRTAQKRAKPSSGSLQLLAQLTFRSAIFDFTPRVGLGIAERKGSHSMGSGRYSVLGAEVKIGPVRLAGDIRRRSNQSEPAYPVFVANMQMSYDYPYDFYPAKPTRRAATTEADLRVSWDLSDRGRLGVRCQAWDESGAFQLFYKFSL